mgnify:CR=1 FL=1
MNLKSYLRSSSFVMALLFMLLLALVSAFVVFALIEQSSVQNHLFMWMGLAALLAMLCIVITSFYISFFVVGRVGQIAETARQIIETRDYSQRIAVESRWDDLSNLAQLLNDFLQRMEIQMQNVRDVSDNIAHDLRTPLAHLRNQLEHLCHSPDKDAAAAALKEADQILKTFHALLRIANIEKGRRHQDFLPFPLHTLLYDVAELYEPLLEEKNISLQTEIPEFYYNGDKDLMFQVFINLMDNALKFTPAGGVIRLTLEVIHNTAVIILSDSGAGIPEAERARVFDRFYRSDTSRHVRGNGLGLSLVRAAIDLHKGTISLADNAPGLRITIHLTNI